MELPPNVEYKPCSMPIFQFYKGGEKALEMSGANIHELFAKVAELK